MPIPVRVCLALLAFYFSSYSALPVAAQITTKTNQIEIVNGSGGVTLAAPSGMSGGVTLTLPGSTGSNGDVLQIDGTGAMSWSAPGAAAALPSGTVLPFNSDDDRTGFYYSGVSVSHGGWTQKTSGDDATAGASGGFINGILYVAGGLRLPSGEFDFVRIYNPSTDSWTYELESNVFSFAASAVLDDKLYVFGGEEGGVVLDQTEFFDPGGNWILNTPMPTARTMAMAAVVGGKAYVIGGKDGTASGAVEEYDPSTNSWASKTAMPTPRYGGIAEVVDDKIYVIGGKDGSDDATGVNEMYDPATDTWSTLSSLPGSRTLYGMGSGSLSNLIYLFAGGDNSGLSTEAFRYIPANDSYEQLADVPFDRLWPTCAVYNNRIYLHGGQNASSVLSEFIYEYSPEISIYYFVKE